MTRLLCAALGTAVAAWGLGQFLGFAPSILGDPPFGFLFAGTCMLSGAILAAAGLIAPEQIWLIGRGRIEIQYSNPFRRWARSFERAEIDGFSVTRRVDLEAPDRWAVVLAASAGRSFQTQGFKTKEEAGRLARNMQACFDG